MGRRRFFSCHLGTLSKLSYSGVFLLLVDSAKSRFFSLTKRFLDHQTIPPGAVGLPEGLTFACKDGNRNSTPTPQTHPKTRPRLRTWTHSSSRSPTGVGLCSGLHPTFLPAVSRPLNSPLTGCLVLRRTRRGRAQSHGWGCRPGLPHPLLPRPPGGAALSGRRRRLPSSCPRGSQTWCHLTAEERGLSGQFLGLRPTSAIYRWVTFSKLGRLHRASVSLSLTWGIIRASLPRAVLRTK